MVKTRPGMRAQHDPGGDQDRTEVVDGQDWTGLGGTICARRVKSWAGLGGEMCMDG